MRRPGSSAVRSAVGRSAALPGCGCVNRRHSLNCANTPHSGVRAAISMSGCGFFFPLFLFLLKIVISCNPLTAIFIERLVGIQGKSLCSCTTSKRAYMLEGQKKNAARVHWLWDDSLRADPTLMCVCAGAQRQAGEQTDAVLSYITQSHPKRPHLMGHKGW